MAKRSRAGEDQLELAGLGEESPSDPARGGRQEADRGGPTAEGAVPDEVGSERRAPFAMGRMSSRTREVHLARGDDKGPIPGPWKLRAVVGSAPGSGSRSGSGAMSEPGKPEDNRASGDPQD